MTGEQMRRALEKYDVTFYKLAQKLGVTSQNLSATMKSPDVKSSYLERIAAILGQSMAMWYGEDCVQVPIINSNNTAGRDISIGSNEQMNALQRQNAQLIEQNNRLSEQNVALTRIIDNLTQR